MLGYRVSPGQLLTTARSTRASADELAAELARLRGIAREVLAADWHGLAAGAFDDGLATWARAAHELIEVLELLADQLAECGHAYVASDAGAGGEFERVAS